MEKQLENLSKKALIALVAQQQNQLESLHSQNDALQQRLDVIIRHLYGSKSEKKKEHINPWQLSIFNSDKLPELPELTEEITYQRTKPAKQHPVREQLPEHLPRKEEHRYPEVDYSNMTELPPVVSEHLDIIPAQLFVRKCIRHKYIDAQGTIYLADTDPQRMLPKSNASNALLAYLIINKYVHHLPIYRQRKMLKDLGYEVSESTLNSWVNQCIDQLDPLYNALVKEVINQPYIMIDETSIQVLDKNKKHKTHTGWLWGYYDPTNQRMFFEYADNRGKKVPVLRLKTYRGTIQTDGYAAYEQFEKYASIRMAICWAHARRYFERALKVHKTQAEQVLQLIAYLYSIERQCREKKCSFEERQQIRWKEAKPILENLFEWMYTVKDQYPPKDPLAKAISYAIKRVEGLSLYLKDGAIEIDNNWIENAIRPIALGRKNYLFVGNHEAGQRTAIIYSLLNTCKIQQVNPNEWLEHVINRINEYPVNNIHELLPQNWIIKNNM